MLNRQDQQDKFHHRDAYQTRRFFHHTTRLLVLQRDAEFVNVRDESRMALF